MLRLTIGGLAQSVCIVCFVLFCFVFSESSSQNKSDFTLNSMSTENESFFSAVQGVSHLELVTDLTPVVLLLSVAPSRTVPSILRRTTIAAAKTKTLV